MIKPPKVRVRTGSWTECRDEVVRLVEKQNFPNRIDFLVPKNVFVSKNIEARLADLEYDYGIVDCSLHTILQSFLKQASEIDIENIQLVSVGQHAEHEDTVSLIRGILTLRLTAESYYRSGLKGVRSVLSQGNKNTRQQLFVVQLDLSQLATEDRNSLRLFWFAEKYQKPLRFAVVGELRVDGLRRVVVQPTVSRLGRLCTPSLVPLDDEEWLSTTLEWLAYASVNGPQLSPFDRTDANVSIYRETVDLCNEEEMYRVSVNGLVSTSTAEQLLQLIATSWIAMLKYGVQDSNVGFGRAEHVPGPNVQALLKNGDTFALWHQSR
ncbi:hypothetical protein KL911_004652 [Ogataea haglerorum]|uniref:uncharacterized protein n=1 Tax=Ogataea haglerorum TaxID=1937702 RepID=UPI001C8AF1F2|nr:uncharacterized protein KL911_004652 [Ogataea haglerorum]KAG7750773.1 hypothetical protein KL911_004652 [Ogataea haglerorum]